MNWSAIILIVLKILAVLTLVATTLGVLVLQGPGPTLRDLLPHSQQEE